MWKLSLRVTVVCSATLCAACGAAPNPDAEIAAEAPAIWEEPTGLAPELMQARAALDRYRDVVNAVHDGYLSTVGCIEYSQGGSDGTIQYEPGGMGVHFLNLQNIGPQLDPARPQVLIYQPVGDSLRLAAAEWFVPADLASGSTPEIFGQKLAGPMAGHRPIMPDGLHHYDLHVWLWKSNPAGVFSPTNPTVKCTDAEYAFDEAAPAMHSAH